MDDYYFIKDNELMIDDCIDKMSKNDPSKHSQIAVEKSIFDYVKWQTLQVRNNVIEKAQIDKSNPDNKDSNSTIMSRDEFAEFVANGGFSE